MDVTDPGIAIMLATITAAVTIPTVYVLLIILSLSNRARVARRIGQELDTERRRIQSHQ